MSYKRYWKFLVKNEAGELRSKNGDHTWEVGKWYTVEGPIQQCVTGFHASERIGQALKYVQGTVLAHVEVKGEKKTSDNKIVSKSMRVVAVYEWTPELSVVLANYYADKVKSLTTADAAYYDYAGGAARAAERAANYATRAAKYATDAAYYTARAARAADTAAQAAIDADRAAERIVFSEHPIIRKLVKVA